jgi:hypothetical protein
VGGQRTADHQQTGESGTSSNDQADSGSGTATGDTTRQVRNAAPEPIVETRWSLVCSGDPMATGMPCTGAPVCPADDGASIDDERMYQYQRLVDPTTGEPITDWQLVGTQCGPADSPLPPQTTDTGGEPAAAAPAFWQLVEAEWQSIQIPSATIGINPLNGRTLVNLDTIFHTTAGEQEFTVTILGQPVTIYAVPVEYTWHHGDGTTQTTTTPGAPYPSKDVTHVYESTGEANPRVDVQYRGEYSIAGGERQPISGFANVTGEGEALQILEARSQLVDG